MPKPKPPVVLLGQLPEGPPASDCFALLASKSRGTTSGGKPYFNCKFQDSTRAATAMIWEDTDWFAPCEAEWQPGMFFKIRGLFSVSEKYGPQISIHAIRPVNAEDKADGFDESHFYERSRFDPDAMFDELLKLAETEINDEPLRQLTLALLTEHTAKLKRLPATQNKFHPFSGGWLEHTLSVARNSLFLVDRYRSIYPEWNPPLNRDVVVSAAILHDLGRVAEYELPILPGMPVEISVDGRLFGHLLLGRDLIRGAAPAILELNPELLKLLEHVVLTHLALPAWGSPQLPAVPEALILHHADDLDAKLETYARALRNDRSDGALTEPDGLLKRSLWKARGV